MSVPGSRKQTNEKGGRFLNAIGQAGWSVPAGCLVLAALLLFIGSTVADKGYYSSKAATQPVGGGAAQFLETAL